MLPVILPSEQARQGPYSHGPDIQNEHIEYSECGHAWVISQWMVILTNFKAPTFLRLVCAANRITCDQRTVVPRIF